MQLQPWAISMLLARCKFAHCRQSCVCLSEGVWLLQMRIDHKNGSVHFSKLQLESDRLRDNIAVLARRLAHAITIIDPVPSADKEAAKKKVPNPARSRNVSTPELHARP